LNTIGNQQDIKGLQMKEKENPNLPTINTINYLNSEEDSGDNDNNPYLPPINNK